ncbi:hypothetical protein [Kitasatospora sp. NPDC088346]|uniref:hypothetical protein n=1 Tax=Kitasatospora sp. NPDC088346 TaxID=3364073 RepID=UPI003803794E
MNLGNPHEIIMLQLDMLQLANEIRTMTGSASPITFVPLPAWTIPTVRRSCATPTALARGPGRGRHC